MEQLTQLMWTGFVLHNLLPVALGYLVGGGVLVGAMYRFIYVRVRPGNRLVWTWRHLTRAPVEARRTTNGHGKSRHEHSRADNYWGADCVEVPQGIYRRGGIKP